MNVQHIQLPMGAKDVPQVDNHILLLSENSRRIVVDATTYIRDVSLKNCLIWKVTFSQNIVHHPLLQQFRTEKRVAIKGDVAISGGILML